MSTQHRGTYQYWKPRRSWSYAKTARVAWAFSLTLILTVFGFVVVATVVMLTKLPPELPLEVLNR
jgi:hypothetical protein